MTSSPLILVTGATGAVGPIVVKFFLDEGYRIRTLSIDQPPVGIWPDDVEARIGDITNYSAVQAAMEGVDSVIHMAAMLHVVNPPPEMREKYERINVGGTATVVDAAIRAGVKRVVLFSTIAVYGPSEGCVLDEMSPTHPATLYAQTKLAAEQIVLNASGADGQPLGTVLRFGAIYGSRIKGNYERLTRSLANHRFIAVGNGLNRRTLIYDKDVGRAVVQAVSHPAAAGRIFNVTDGGFHILNEIIEAICSGLGRTSPRLSLPVEPTRTLIHFIEAGIRVVGLKPPVTREMIDKYTEDIAVDGSLFQKEIGFVPQYDLKTGWKETICEMYEDNSFK
ncbi:MAG: NAD-dependent epimerase/dehydratase family protein [Smithellaceae bacterium]